MIGPPVLRRRILKGSGQPDRERAAVLMEGGGNAFMSYMNFGDEQDRSSFPTDDLAAQCAFVLGHLPGCDTKHITAPTCARPEEDVSKLLLSCMGKKASTGRRGSSTCAACGLSLLEETPRFALGTIVVVFEAENPDSEAKGPRQDHCAARAPPPHRPRRRQPGRHWCRLERRRRARRPRTWAPAACTCQDSYPQPRL